MLAPLPYVLLSDTTFMSSNAAVKILFLYTDSFHDDLLVYQDPLIEPPLQLPFHHQVLSTIQDTCQLATQTSGSGTKLMGLTTPQNSNAGDDSYRDCMSPINRTVDSWKLLAPGRLGPAVSKHGRSVSRLFFFFFLKTDWNNSFTSLGFKSVCHRSCFF